MDAIPEKFKSQINNNYLDKKNYTRSKKNDNLKQKEKIREKSSCDSTGINFSNIVGYDDIKKIFNFALNSSMPVHILLVGPPGSAKTLFLTELMKIPRSYFTLGSHSTRAGMIDYLFNNRPKNLIVDEIEYMPIKDQAVLLSLMETGILSETKFQKTRTTNMKTQVFASCNDEKKLLTPLLSRFLVLHFKKYDYKTFEKITVHILLRERNTDTETAKVISSLVWNKLKSKDIRDCIKIGRICNNKEDVHMIIKTLISYNSCALSSKLLR